MSIVDATTDGVQIFIKVVPNASCDDFQVLLEIV